MAPKEKYGLVGEQSVVMRDALKFQSLDEEDDEEYTEEERQSLAKTFAMAKVHHMQFHIVALRIEHSGVGL